MAVLSDTDRQPLWAEFMRDVSNRREPFGALTKAQLRDAVNALDDYLNTNAAAINAAIPQPARAQLTTPQKALLLQYVVAKRYLTGA